MNERAAILRSILENPDDDAPRLIFADWLEEHDEHERAEFIRVQCDIAREIEYSARWKKLARREKALLKEHKKEWTQAIQGIGVFALLQRGFVEKVTLLATKFIAHGAALLYLEPVTEVKFVYRETEPMIEVAPRLAGCNLLARLHGLDFDNVPFPPAALDRLLESEHLGNLRTLRFGFAGVDVITTSAIGRLLATSQTPQLSALDIRNMRSEGSSFALALSRGRLTQSLQSLHLNDCELTRDDLIAITQSGPLRSLRRLHIRNPRYRRALAAALPGPVLLSQLTHLHYSGCDVGDAALGEMARSPSAHLRHLTLSSCAIGDGGAIALAGAQSLQGLRYLNLNGNQITNRGAEALRQSQALSELGYLNLGANQIDDDMQKQLRERFGKGVCTFAT